MMVDKVLSINTQKLWQKKQLLDKYRPFSEVVINNLLEWFKVELTYSSNAIEGNTLSRLETAIVIEKGITIGGKLLKEHLEAKNHAKAFDFIISLVKDKQITEYDILEIHKIVLSSIEDEYAGKYRDVRVKIAGSDVIFPNYAKVPELMQVFLDDINREQDPIKKALHAHYEFVTIHPFVDGNGRTARLLMNLLLMQNGFPPAIIKPKDRLKYLKSLEMAQLGGSRAPYIEFMIKAINRSLDIYINAFTLDVTPQIIPRENLIKIGELATSAKETIATIRYWAKLGLIEVSETLASGYQLFDASEIEKCLKIREFQKQRLTLEEIGLKLDGMDEETKYS
jgi:Fic family protein